MVGKGRNAKAAAKFKRILQALLDSGGTETQPGIDDDAGEASWLCIGCRSYNFIAWMAEAVVTPCGSCGDEEKRQQKKQKEKGIHWDGKARRCKDSQGRVAKCP